MIDHADYIRTASALIAIPPLIETLEAELINGRSTTTTRNKPGSRPPAPIGLMSDIDEAWNIVTTWARDWAETYDYTPPAPYWTDVTQFLARHWPNLSKTHPAADDFAHEIAGYGGLRPSVWQLLARHTLEGQPTWQKLPGRWLCPIADPDPCGGQLLQKTGEWLIRCPDCHEKWSGDLEVERLGRLLGCEIEVTIDQAALLTHVHKSTIYRWIETRQLPTTLSEDGRTVVDKRDLVLITTRKIGA